MALRDAGAEVDLPGAAAKRRRDRAGGGRRRRRRRSAISVLSGAHLPLAARAAARSRGRTAWTSPSCSAARSRPATTQTLRDLGVAAVYPVGHEPCRCRRRRAVRAPVPSRSDPSEREPRRDAPTPGIPVERSTRPSRRRRRPRRAARRARGAPVHARALSHRCTAASSGRCGSSRGSGRRRRRTSGSASCSSGARPRCPSRSTCRPSSATTRAIRTARAEVGRVGVAIDTADDMVDLFAGLPLDRRLRELHDQRDRPDHPGDVSGRGRAPGRRVRADLAGTLQNDILKEFLARKTFVFPPEPSMRLSCDVIEFAAGTLPRFNPISITGLPRARGRLRRRAGARAHAGLGDRVRGGADRARAGVRRVRPPALVPLRDHDGSVRGGGEAPRRAADVVPDRDRAVRRERSAARAACGSSRGTPARRSPRSSRSTT